MSSTPSRFELIFDKISFTIDLITEKYQITGFVEIAKLVETIRNADDPENGIENIQEVFQEYKVTSFSQINDKIIYYLASKVSLIYPNALADLYIGNPKNNFSIEQINYNLLLKTPENFKEYFLSSSSFNPSPLSINAENPSQSVFNLNLTNKLGTGINNNHYNTNGTVGSNYQSNAFISSKEIIQSSIKNLLDPARKVNLQQIVQKRVLMQDIEIKEDEIYERIRGMLSPKVIMWEKNFEDRMTKFFEYIDEDSKNFYKYVISFHTLEIREELVKYYQENFKAHNLNVTSEDRNKFLQYYLMLEFKYRLVIMARIYNFITGVSMVFDFISSNQVNLRFYTDELTYIKVAEFFGYPLQIKPYALKYSMLEKKCKIKDEDLHMLMEESNDSSSNFNIVAGGTQAVINKNNNEINNKENFGEAENEQLLGNKTSNLEREQTEKSRVFNGINHEKLHLSTLNLDVKLGIMCDKVTEMNNEFRQLKFEDLDYSNHLNFPPYEICTSGKYEKFKNYDEKDDFIENDIYDDFMNFLPNKKKNKRKVNFFKKEVLMGLKQDFLTNIIKSNREKEEKSEEEKAIIEMVQNYFDELDLPNVNFGISIFKSIDKLRLLTLSFDKIFRLEKLKNSEFLNLSYFHRNPETQIYSEKQWSFLKDSVNIFSNKTKMMLMNHLRNYLGEEISFYLLWLQELIISLAIPSFLGLIAYVLLIIKITNDKNQIVLMSDTRVFDFFHLQICIGDIIQISLCFMVGIWCFIFLQHWKSLEKFYSYIWGCGDSEQLEQQQESYVCKEEVNFIFDWKIKIQDKTMYHMKKLFSISISALLVVLVIFINFSLLVIKRDRLRGSDPYSLTTEQLFWTYFPTVLNAVLIKLMSFIYRTVASKLSYWENHEKNSKRVANLSFKIFLFEFVNNFFTYYYIGFYKSFRDECTEKNCMHEIQIQSYLSLAIIASINILEIGIPYLIYLMKLRKLKSKNEELAKANSTLIYNHNQNLIQTELVDIINSDEMKIELSSMDCLIEDYIEIIIYLAYVLLITSIAPLTPLFILILLMSERSIDAFKIYYFMRVEFLNSFSGVSIYNYMIRIILYAGAITNLGLVLFSRKFKNIDKDPAKSEVMTFEDSLLKLLILLIFENLFFFIGSVIRFKDYTDWIENTGLIENSYNLMYFNVNKQNLPHINNVRLVSEKNHIEKNQVHKKKEMLKKLEVFYNDPLQLISNSGNKGRNTKNLPMDRIVLDKIDYEMQKGL